MLAPRTFALAAQELAQLGPIAGSAMDQRTADQRARCVKLRHHARHAERAEQPRFKVICHRLAAHIRVFAIGQRTRGNIGQDHAGAGRIFELRARLGFKRLLFRPSRHIVAAIEEQHAHFARFVGRVTGFRVPQTAAHLQQLAQCDLAARIARALPQFNRRALVKPQAAIRH